MQKYWLFLDFDNTLMATEQYAVPSLIARFNALYAQSAGKELTLSVFKQYFHGQARETLCQNLSDYFGITVDYKTLYESREARMMQYLKEIPEGIAMAPHLIETLAPLSSQGVILSLVSNNPIQRALCAMRFANNQQGDALASLFGTRFFEAGNIQKPHPEVYLRAMQQVDALSENSIAVEDSITGAKAALAAGLTTLAFTGFAENPQEQAQTLQALGCKAAFDDWRQMPAILAKLS
ncbi:HAD-IA family hydrolase [Candidatus Berkiella aquae]|uniref:phosphoglycolate phosphatase n=1 Tax=Candidatus Berkiella aquae TaxID=295108 RepID=A0A0Q9YK45_9GAMM|nr:HAD-IA family hydrolase [Candidatus Berkiella aquae]MCS5709985.1 HAD family hydrolase [Candidatus Berkiella aquae]